ncbi:hypothetical protein DFH09DRAFT_1086728 [Mycena vulgaris]|nr:hypothetical protein DFH09DRAFT_1104617 [Mycena vulgaris]KAJ6550468.1 hypothetical protein DFH09DRAFT_1086728 [Mycena vulgaris]
MRFNFCLLVAISAEVIFARSPPEIMTGLDDLTSQAKETTVLLKKIPADTDSSDISRVCAGATGAIDGTQKPPKNSFKQRTFTARRFQSWESLYISFQYDGALYLARALRTYAKYGYYVEGCNDGVTIELRAIEGACLNNQPVFIFAVDTL